MMGILRAYHLVQELWENALKRKRGKIVFSFLPLHRPVSLLCIFWPTVEALAPLIFTNVTFFAFPLPPSTRQREHQNLLTEDTFRDVMIFHNIHSINIHNHTTMIFISMGQFNVPRQFHNFLKSHMSLLPSQISPRRQVKRVPILQMETQTRALK